MHTMLGKELFVLLLAAAPISELRGAIPVAIAGFGFSVEKAFLLSVIGNALPVIPLLIGLERISAYLSRRSYFFNRFFSWLFEHTRVRHGHHFEFWGSFALFMFVAFPLPFTGAWSGAVAAFVFGIPFRRSVVSIALGIIAAGIAVTAATVTGANIFSHL